MNRHEILSALEYMARGLILKSGDDFPLKAFVWYAPDVRGFRPASESGVPCTPAELLAYCNLPSDSLVETATPATVFGEVCQDQPEDTPEILAARSRFLDLLWWFDPRSDAVVYRIGRGWVTVYMLCSTGKDGIAGVQTNLLETE